MHSKLKTKNLLSFDYLDQTHPHIETLDPFLQGQFSISVIVFFHLPINPFSCTSTNFIYKPTERN